MGDDLSSCLAFLGFVTFGLAWLLLAFLWMANRLDEKSDKTKCVCEDCGDRWETQVMVDTTGEVPVGAFVWNRWLAKHALVL